MRVMKEMLVVRVAGLTAQSCKVMSTSKAFQRKPRQNNSSQGFVSNNQRVNEINPQIPGLCPNHSLENRSQHHLHLLIFNSPIASWCFCTSFLMNSLLIWRLPPSRPLTVNTQSMRCPLLTCNIIFEFHQWHKVMLPESFSAFFFWHRKHRL